MLVNATKRVVGAGKIWCILQKLVCRITSYVSMHAPGHDICFQLCVADDRKGALSSVGAIRAIIGILG